jgi:hypothetical protein
VIATAGWPCSIQAFEPATWAGPRRADSFATDPYKYPGVRPTGSYLVKDGQITGLDPAPDGWVTRDGGEPVDVGGRHLVVAYGSNADPDKLTEKLNGTAAGSWRRNRWRGRSRGPALGLLHPAAQRVGSMAQIDTPTTQEPTTPTPNELTAA